ncbi:hypothetical protein HPB49_017969 [Dermacentor silvarum]|uniref:Uncharacterized protein n=1 Tax=Dermacentor silvarum TaxID=543639 RepID=A0ACB8DF31_DERSI|nr:hypothetical protein HPB49_017969 [Dermacentor silvarum]
MIVVDGNIGSGKSALAKTIAEEFELKHFPETFYEDPHNRNVARMQMLMYTLRFEQHIDALVHIMNTGQGVVLERSCFSDFVFADAMHKLGYISRNAWKMYHKCRHYTIFQMLKPHLVIYLDVPSDILLQRIRERNRPEEVNSKVLTKAYLEAIESAYKKDYLRSIRKETELLMYDWSHFGDTEMVLDDIEHIDFEGYLDDPYGPMLADWKKKEDIWDDYRYRLTTEKEEVLNSLDLDYFDAPELAMSGEDTEQMLDIIEKFNDKRKYFQEGYNKHLGDRGLLFKMKNISKWEQMRYRWYLNKY